jgi:MinD-like ATPase involved in chromosome partitioning or flagellar assembly
MIVALMSAKGAPGVTTAALCLAGTQSPDALMIEADPAGGDLECWSGPHGEPGLVTLATSLRPGLTGGQVQSHAVEAVPGVRAVVAPTTGTAASAALTTAGEWMGAALDGVDGTVFADVGRWSPTQTTASRVAGADLVLIVCRPTLDSIEHARDLVAAAAAAVESPIALVLVGGDQPYGPNEVARALGVPVVGSLPWEPRAVLGLVSGGARDRRWQRSQLAAASADLAAAVSRTTATAGVRADA